MKVGAMLAAAAVSAFVVASAIAAVPAGTFAGCPRGLLSPPPSYRAQARRVTTRFLHTTYARWNVIHHWRTRLAGAQVGTPSLVRHWLPSGWVREECGKTVWLRSVVVGVGLPAMEYPNPIGPCADCAHVTFLLGETRHGWTVWGND